MERGAMTPDLVGGLEEKARQVRRAIIKMIHAAGSGHPGGSLSAADILTVLYFNEMNVDPRNPALPERDRFILSKGHACPVQYACLALKGYFSEDILLTLRKEGSILQGHPSMNKCPGIDISTGSLGQGLSAGVGMAIAAKRDSMQYRVFVLLGDGETQEGQVWEAVMSAVKYRLDNLIFFIDHNGLQNDGFCDDIMPLLDLAGKMREFGCDVYRVDGHDISEILDALDRVKKSGGGAPHCIIARTVKGKGVSFMENVPEWHGKAPDEEQYSSAIRELGGNAL